MVTRVVVMVTRALFPGKIIEEIARGLEYTKFVEMFTEAEFTSFYLKKYTEREERLAFLEV